jgi:Carboxypeptidase regulatory-like domain
MNPAARLLSLVRLSLPAAALSTLLVGSTVAHAQVTPVAPPANLAILRGSVGDSIHSEPLSGAVVVVEGTDRTGLTRADGTFQIDSIPPGSRRISIMHPLLDTIGIPMRSGAISFAAGATQTIEFAVPSGDRLAALLCTAAWRERFGPAVVIGFVRDPDTNGPAIGAKVEVVYTGTDIIGRKMPPSSRSAVVDSTGLYHICGLPADMTGKVQVFRNGVASGEVPISVEHNIAVRAFSVAGKQAIALVKNDSGKVVRVATGTARLTGKVTDKLGKPLENARVMLQGGAKMAITKANGDFVLDSLPSGTQALVVRRLGFGVTEQAVELSANTPARANVKMEDYVALAPVVVEAAKESGLAKVGYLDRKHMGMGQFMDGTAINHQALAFSDVLRMARGLKVQPLGDGRTYVVTDSRSTNGCLNYYLDGTPWTTMTPGDIDDVARPDEIVAVEIYHGGETPPQYSTPGQSSCATVVIWTVARVRDANATKKRP